VSATRDYIFPLIRHFLKHPLPQETFLNVTFPYDCKNGVKGFRMAKQGRGYWVEAPDKRIHPEGLPYYWLGGKWSIFEEDPESDVTLLEQGYVTGVPIHVGQLTDREAFEKHKDLIDEIFEPKDAAKTLS
jgi:5'-nucleotidase